MTEQLHRCSWCKPKTPGETRRVEILGREIFLCPICFSMWGAVMERFSALGRIVKNGRAHSRALRGEGRE